MNGRRVRRREGREERRRGPPSRQETILLFPLSSPLPVVLSFFFFSAPLLLFFRHFSFASSFLRRATPRDFVQLLQDSRDERRVGDDEVGVLNLSICPARTFRLDDLEIRDFIQKPMTDPEFEENRSVTKWLNAWNNFRITCTCINLIVVPLIDIH